MPLADFPHLTLLAGVVGRIMSEADGSSLPQPQWPRVQTRLIADITRAVFTLTNGASGITGGRAIMTSEY